MKVRQKYGFIESDKHAVSCIDQGPVEDIRTDIAHGAFMHCCRDDDIVKEIYGGTLELRDYVADADSIQEWYTAYRQTLSCVDCGRVASDVNLQFHHVKPQSKKYNVSEMVSGLFSKEEILDEMSQCVPVCWSCHTVRTAGQLRRGIIKPGKNRRPRVSKRRVQEVSPNVSASSHPSESPKMRKINGRALKALREHAGYKKQSDAARAAGISASYLSSLETGRRGSTMIDTLQKIAICYGFTLEIRMIKEVDGTIYVYNLLV